MQLVPAAKAAWQGYLQQQMWRASGRGHALWRRSHGSRWEVQADAGAISTAFGSHFAVCAMYPAGMTLDAVPCYLLCPMQVVRDVRSVLGIRSFQIIVLQGEKEQSVHVHAMAAGSQRTHVRMECLLV